MNMQRAICLACLLAMSGCGKDFNGFGDYDAGMAKPAKGFGGYTKGWAEKEAGLCSYTGGCMQESEEENGPKTGAPRHDSSGAHADSGDGS